MAAESAARRTETMEKHVTLAEQVAAASEKLGPATVVAFLAEIPGGGFFPEVREVVLEETEVVGFEADGTPLRVVKA